MPMSVSGAIAAAFAASAGVGLMEAFAPPASLLAAVAAAGAVALVEAFAPPVSRLAVVVGLKEATCTAMKFEQAMMVAAGCSG